MTNRQRAAEYRADAEIMRRALERLDRNDPEAPEAAREWSEQIDHALLRADDCERWAAKTGQP